MVSDLLGRLRDRTVAPAREVAGEVAEGAAQGIAEGIATGRRDRVPSPAERQLGEAVAQKILHGWLQNRHQTLMPLSVSLTRLAEDDRARVVRFAAVAATAGDRADGPDRLATWLATAGADGPALAAYRAALAAPPALSGALAEMDAPERIGIAYVLALVAAGEGEVGDAGHAFAEYVARRLALPSAALRSAQRRYGR